MLFLSGCNAGHQDYKYTNLAYYLAQKVNGGKVIACDGTDYHRSGYNTGVEEYTSRDDDTWEDWRDDAKSTRKTNEGWIVYQKDIIGKTRISKSIGKSLTLTDMLNKVYKGLQWK